MQRVSAMRTPPRATRSRPAPAQVPLLVVLAVLVLPQYRRAVHHLHIAVQAALAAVRRVDRPLRLLPLRRAKVICRRQAAVGAA